MAKKWELNLAVPFCPDFGSLTKMMCLGETLPVGTHIEDDVGNTVNLVVIRNTVHCDNGVAHLVTVDVAVVSGYPFDKDFVERMIKSGWKKDGLSLSL